MENLKLYTVKDASQELGIGENKMYALINAGVIRAIKIGGIKIRATTLEEFLGKYDGYDLTDPQNIIDMVSQTPYNGGVVMIGDAV